MHRVVTLDIPGEAAGSVLFRLASLNASWAHLALPVWDSSTAPADAPDTLTLTLTAPMPHLGGWTLLGTWDAGSPATALPGTTGAEVPDLPEGTAAVCATCGTRRGRKHLLLAGPDGEIATVAHGECWTGFVHEHGLRFHKPVDLLVDPASLLARTARNVTDSEHLDTDLVLAAAMALIERHGYLSRQQAERTYGIATSEHLAAMAGILDEHGAVRWPAEVYDRMLAAAVLRLEILEEMAEDTSEFTSRLRETLARPEVTRHAFGIVAAAPSAYARHERARAAAEAGHPDPATEYCAGHVGQVGQRITVPGVRVEQVRTVATGSTLVVLRDPDGHRLTWFATQPGAAPPVDAVVTVTGTVKAHKTFRGVDDTTLSRCVFA